MDQKQSQNPKKPCEHSWIIWSYPNGFDKPGRRICKHCQIDLGETDHLNFLKVQNFIAKLLNISYRLSKTEHKFLIQIAHMPLRSFDWKTCDEVSRIYRIHERYIGGQDQF